MKDHRKMIGNKTQIDGTNFLRYLDVKNSIYRLKIIIQQIGVKTSANRRDFSSAQKWNLSHFKQCRHTWPWGRDKICFDQGSKYQDYYKRKDSWMDCRPVSQKFDGSGGGGGVDRMISKDDFAAALAAALWVLTGNQSCRQYVGRKVLENNFISNPFVLKWFHMSCLCLITPRRFNTFTLNSLYTIQRLQNSY